MAGRPSRTTATGSSRAASTSAFTKWVVPIITAEVSTAPSAVIAAATPEVTSAVVGDLTAASTSPLSPSRAASVLVPPTSIPMRIMLSSGSLSDVYGGLLDGQFPRPPDQAQSSRGEVAEPGQDQ